MTIAEHNMKVLDEKYNLVKHRIDQDRVRIDELQSENRKLSDFLSKQFVLPRRQRSRSKS